MTYNMKNSFLNLRAMLLLAVLLCGGVSTFADYVWQDGINYALYDDLTAYVSDADNKIMTANIPEKITYEGKDYTVTGIGLYAFSGCHSLASVVIPSSVTSIGQCAFSGCRSLASVVIPSSVTSIRDDAFYGCSSLLAYRLYSGSTAYVYDAGDSILTANIPEKITYMGNEYSVTRIGGDAFYGCGSLASVVIPNSVTSIGYSAFSGCSSLASVVIPSSVTSIGEWAFYNCYNLASVVIPSSVTNIGEYAFGNCPSLSNVTIGIGVQSIDETAFKYNGYYNKKGFSYLYGHIEPIKVIWLGNTPPEGYKNVQGQYNYVSNDSFTGLSNTKVYPFLSSMFEKDGIKYVPVNPSERTCDAIDCAYDSTAANINIGKTVNYKGVELAVNDIRPYTCYGNGYVKSVKVDYGGAVPICAFYGCESIVSADIAATKIGASAFENSATKNPAKFVINADMIENRAFKGSKAITEAKITAKIIGTSAFENCATENPAKFEISADKIGNYAFDGNSAITEAKITAKTIGASAFENSATKEPAKFEITADTIENNAFTGCCKMENTVLGESLKSIGNSAFKDCASLKGITIPDSVTGIGGRCFSGCESLAYAKIGAGVSVIPDEAFNNCKSLPEITIPKTVERIGNNVFPGCFALTDVTIADRETELKLGSNVKSPMFSSCPLKSVYIGGNITYGTTANDGYSPFYRNTSLETVRITDSETEISENEFYGCTSLKSVSMGDGIETIGRYAFSGCSALESFSFGTGLKSIGDEAFSDCTGMKKLVSKTAVPPVCGSQALDDINKWECTLYVPQASLDAYKSAAQWKEFFFLETGIKNVPNTSSSATESARYSTDGTRLASPQKGINIIRMSDGTVKKVLVK